MSLMKNNITKGLPRELRYAISDRLEARDADFESDQVPEVEKAMEASCFVLRKAVARGGWGRRGRKEEGESRVTRSRMTRLLGWRQGRIRRKGKKPAKGGGEKEESTL